MAETDTGAGTASTALRLALLGALAVALLAALLARLWFLQVMSGEEFATLAEDNRLRYLVVEAPRGEILTADGGELVRNRPAQAVSINTSVLLDGLGEPKDGRAEVVLGRLATLLETDVDALLEATSTKRWSPFRVVPVAQDVDPEVVFTLAEHAELFEGVVAETLPVRDYPNAAAAAHLVGYLGEISDEDLAEERYADHKPGDTIGWAGLEHTYEDDLRGVEGLRELEVNARGRVLNVLSERPPVRGNDLVTSIELDAQVATEQILQAGLEASRQIVRSSDGRRLISNAGAAVVLDARDNRVVAMASSPTYDPAEFTGGVGTDYWGFLQAPDNDYPLINRAIQSAYPPGSVFKVVTGAAMLEAGLITPASRVACPSSYRLGSAVFRNWNPRSEGAMDLSRALTRSCDTFFYHLAAQQWAREEAQDDAGQPVDEVLTRVSHDFGLGRTLGIDTTSERPGIIPGREWRQRYWESTRERTCAQADEVDPSNTSYKRLLDELCVDGGVWRGGDAVNTSIGQGDVLTTPLQIAAAYGAIANGGTLYQPLIGREVLAPDGELVRTLDPEVVSRLPVTPEGLAEIREGLANVVMGAGGTGRGAFSGFPLEQVPVAGKTGTAEAGSRIPYAWFASYAPVSDPRYVVVVAVEQGGGGSQTAAPIARRIHEVLFDLEPTPFPGQLEVAW